MTLPRSLALPTGSVVTMASIVLPGVLGSVRAHAAPIVNEYKAVITADNYYAVYAERDGALDLIGRNEVGPLGQPGSFNWSLPERFSVTASSPLYVAVWSDNGTTQGFLADVWLNGVRRGSNAANWRVIPTYIDLGDFSPAPSPDEVSQFIGKADARGLWEVPFQGGVNGISPWGVIPGISTQSNWIWWKRPGAQNPLDGQSGVGEYIIFRFDGGLVPSPAGATALMVAGVTLGAMRRRTNPRARLA